MTRHFNVTIYIIDPKTNKFLFIKHKKLNKWLSPGGHIEENENPERAALREVKEETGLDVKLIGDRLPEESDLIRPYGLQLNIIAENEHEHIDLIYLATPTTDTETVLNEEETDDIAWFSLGQILKDDFDTFKKNEKWCIFFFKLINKKH